MSVPADLITPKEAAHLAGVHTTTLLAWVRAGKLRGYRRAGSRYLVSRADVLALITPVEVVPEVRGRTAAEQELAAAMAAERLRRRGYRV